jgi:subtilisin family serine protease
MIPSKRSWLALLIVAGMLLSSVAPVFAQDDEPLPDPTLPEGSSLLFLPAMRNDPVTKLTVPAENMTSSARGTIQRAVPASVSALKLSEPLQLEGGIGELKLAPSLRQAQGKVSVVVQMAAPSLVEFQAASGMSASADMAAAAVSAVEAQQAQVVASAQSLDSSVTVLGSVHKVLNAVMLEIDAAAVKQLAADPSVRSVRPVINYERDLAETVPYIGAKAVQDLGFDGTGVKVAVLDSGIDYTHAAFGGPGTLEAYELAYGIAITDTRNTTRDGLFPTAKVVEGIDFVGEAWPNGPLAIDEDPIDFEGHGTHVGDIIGGAGGVAPGVDLYAVKVCSAVSSSCSGVALIQGMDYVVDPNGDDDTSDRMDIVNMSLGSSYGMVFDDDLSQAVEAATLAGVLTVASAGNSADKPFIVGTPSAAPSALSVAQTEVPSSKLPAIQILSPTAIAGTIYGTYQTFSAPFTNVIEGPLQYGDGAGGNLLGCTNYPAGSLTGKILLVNRGSCAISIKVSSGAAGGAIAVIVGLIAPGDPSQFSFGGGNPAVPGFVINQADANRLRAGLADGVTLRLDPAAQVSLAQHVVGSSSRGPTMLTHIIKPEIGAPGASVSALVGTGTETEAFGGTSGAAPMVSGAAALLKQAYPTRGPAEIKAVLVNTGETNIMNKAAALGGKLAPITRIGGGEVRVDRALKVGAAAWDANTGLPTVSLGFNDWVRNNLLTRAGITVRNYSNTGKTFNIAVSFRYPDDEVRGGVTIQAPRRVFASANSVGNFGINFRVRTDRLDPWTLNSGANGANADLLSTLEYDGYITLTNVADPNEVIRIPWQILPRGVGEIGLQWRNGFVQVRNNGVATSTVEAYSLLGENGNQPAGGPGEQNPTPDFRYFGYATYPVAAGVCSANPSFIMAFATNTFEPQTHANYPFSFEVDIDADQDGDVDYAVFTAEQGYPAFAGDGRNLTYVLNVETRALGAFFYTDHDMKSGNTVMLICGEQIGMNATNFFDPMDIVALAVDNYFTGAVTDFFDGITISPLGEQYIGLFENGGPGATTLAPKQTDKLRLLDLGELTNNTENGLLLLYRNGAQRWVEAAVLYASK